MNEEIYIHYGSTYFDINRFNPIKNRMYINKPIGGFWASPVDSKYGWKQWCEEERYAVCNEKNSFKFTLKNNAHVYHIYSKKDVFKMPHQKSISEYVCPDFEKMLDIGYDAIEFHLSQEKIYKYYDESIYYILYGWDCDSILILNPNIIVPLSSSIG